MSTQIYLKVTESRRCPAVKAPSKKKVVIDQIHYLQGDFRSKSTNLILFGLHVKLNDCHVN